MSKKRKGKKARKTARKAVRKPAARKPARRKAAPAPRVKTKTVIKRVVVKQKAATLSPQEAQGMKVLARLADNQFCEDGKLAHASGFVKRLSESERRAMQAARERLKKTVGA